MRVLLIALVVAGLAGCGPKKLVHAGPIVFRDMVCTRAAEPVCTCEVPMLVFNAKTGADEVICRKGK